MIAFSRARMYFSYAVTSPPGPASKPKSFFLTKGIAEISQQIIHHEKIRFYRFYGSFVSCELPFYGPAGQGQRSSQNRGKNRLDIQ